MKSSSLSLLSLVGCALGHQQMVYPPARSSPTNSQAGITNGIVFGAGGISGGSQIDNRVYHNELHSSFKTYPCGGAPNSEYRQTVYNGRSTTITDDREAFDFSRPPADGRYTDLVAGSELTINTEGYFHPGVMRVAICFEDCMDAANFEQNILGYWFHQGCDGSPAGDIYSAKLDIKVKVPMRNSNHAVLQWLDDTQDGRSYVTCADVKITGGTADPGFVECNGHPFCDCGGTGGGDTPSDSPSDSPAGGAYGLRKMCPSGGPWSYPQEASPPYNYPGTAQGQMGQTEFCKYCAQDGCPASCGSQWDSAYVLTSGQRKPGNVERTGLPDYMVCNKDTHCRCPGCFNKDPWSTYVGTSPPTSSGPQPTPAGQTRPPTPQYIVSWTVSPGVAITKGNDLGANEDNGEPLSAAQCRVKCAADARCLGISFTDTLCWLKSVTGPTIADPNFTTELKVLTLPPPTTEPTSDDSSQAANSVVPSATVLLGLAILCA